MPRRTNPFQRLVTSIMAVLHEPEYSVQESVLERNQRTGVVREIDVRITSRTDPDDRTLVECRAHKRKQDVQWIDAIEGKARSLGFSKVVAVSESGFTQGALAEAKDRGIEALNLREAEEVKWGGAHVAISEMKVEIEGPVFRSVDFGVDAEWQGEMPKSVNAQDVILVDTRDGTEIPFFAWLEGLLTDPEQAGQLRALAAAGNTVDLQKTHPCSPGMGFVVQGAEREFIPLVAVTVHVDYVFSHDTLPLKSLDVGGRQLLAGEGRVRGDRARMVIYESDGVLKVLLDREPAPKDRQGGDPDAASV